MRYYFRYYFIYKTRDINGNITSVGISRNYYNKNEMWENLEFQRLCGFECIPKVEEVFY